MSDNKIWIGADPGGKGKFGLAILNADGNVCSCCVDHVDEAVDKVRLHVQDVVPAGVGIDAPLWWSSGRAGLRSADVWIRERYDPPANVLAVNCLWGAVLAQGMMFADRMRNYYPRVPITETHPKALLRSLNKEYWHSVFEALSTTVAIDDEVDDQRDAVLSAIAAREGFEGRWVHDLSARRGSNEQNPKAHWLSPVHYFWPEK